MLRLRRRAVQFQVMLANIRVRIETSPANKSNHNLKEIKLQSTEIPYARPALVLNTILCGVQRDLNGTTAADEAFAIKLLQFAVLTPCGLNALVCFSSSHHGPHWLSRSFLPMFVMSFKMSKP